MKKQPKKKRSVRRLTLKQRKFVQEYIKHEGNGTRAALEAYNVKDKTVASTIANENLNKPYLVDSIELALKKQGITDETITEALAKNLIKGAGVRARASDSNKAAEILLKLKGKLSSSSTQSLHYYDYRNMNKQELIKERERLKQLYDNILS